MEQNNQIKLVRQDNRYELNFNKKITVREYENILQFLSEKLKIQQVEEVNDYDTVYHSFNYQEQKIVLSYSIFFGISIYLFDQTVALNIQENFLKGISQTLSHYNFSN